MTQIVGSIQNLEPSRPLAILNDRPDASSLVEIKNIVHEAMKMAMREDTHYGVIPGCHKPSLYKAGAELLGMLFRLAPSYDIVSENHEPTYTRYLVKCTLRHIQSGHLCGEGLGSCNTRESKYRYRYVPAPADAPKDAVEEAVRKAEGQGTYRKIAGKQVWHKTVDNAPEINDNTVLKMACKRAMVAAILNATGASDIFTQDMEDSGPELSLDDNLMPKTPAQEEARKLNVKDYEQLVRLVPSQVELTKLWNDLHPTKEHPLYHQIVEIFSNAKHRILATGNAASANNLAAASV